MKYNKDVAILAHIIDYCDDITNTVERFNGNKEMLDTDRDLFLDFIPLQTGNTHERGSCIPAASYLHTAR